MKAVVSGLVVALLLVGLLGAQAVHASTTYIFSGTFQETKIDSITHNADGTYTINDEGNDYGGLYGHWIYWSTINMTTLKYTGVGVFYGSIGGAPPRWVEFYAWGQAYVNGSVRELDVPTTTGYSGWVYYVGFAHPPGELGNGTYSGQITVG